MSNRKETEHCGSRNFEEKEEKIVELTKNSVKIAYPIYWEGLNLVKDVINLLIDDATNCLDDSSKKFSLAYLLLINRSLQHIESVRLLTERGLYGDGKESECLAKNYGKRNCKSGGCGLRCH